MKLLLDNQVFTSKPTKIDVMEITNRIIKYPVDLNPEELAHEIIKGKSFTPALLSTPYLNKLSRSKNCWTEQQVLCLDFDNERYDHKLKEKIKDVKITIQQAIEEFKESAMFMYKSFSHKEDHHKFRVVFALQTPISNKVEFEVFATKLLDKYPYADQSSLQLNRLFYGGYDLYVYDYNNRLQVECKNNNETYCDYDSTKVLSNDYHSHNIPLPDVNVYLSNQSVDYVHYTLGQIKSKDINKLHTVLSPTPVEFYTYNETIEYIKKQDLRVFLGMNDTRFRCIFHDDHSDSARIFVSDKSGDVLYCCHSSNCNFGTGNIIKCVEWLLKCNRTQALRFLRKVYKIGFHQTEWQKEQIEYMDENIRYVQSEEFEYSHPNQYKLIKNYIGDLVNFWNIVKDYLPPEHYSLDQSKVLFFASLSHFSRVYGNKHNNEKRIGDRLSLFTYLGYIIKLKETEIPEKLLKESKKYLVKSRTLSNRDSYSLIQHYGAYPLTQDVLVNAEGKAQEFKENQFTMRGWSWEMIARALGEEEANRVYPQLEGKKTKIREKSHKMTTEIETIAMRLIDEKRWTTEKEILENVDLTIITTKTGKERQMKKIIGEVMQKYGLIKFKLNKILSDELNIPPTINENGGIGYPVVIYKKN